MVTIYGEVLRATAQQIILSVATQLGDARHFGLIGNLPIPLAHVTRRFNQQHQLEEVRLPFELADLLSKSCQPCD